MKVKSNRIKLLKIFLTVAVVTALFAISAVTVFAAGDVSSAIESTWTAAQTQIKNVVNNVVFPAFGGDTIIPLCPFPIGETRSTIRIAVVQPGFSRRIL